MLNFILPWLDYFDSKSEPENYYRLFTSFCWICMVAMAIGISDIVRYVLGPLPAPVCSVQQFAKSSVKTTITMMYNAISLTRYIMIFHLKNPTAVKDEFWSLFITLWIIAACALTNFVYEFLPGLQDLSYYTCSGLDTAQDLELPRKKEGFALLFSLIFQILVNSRISLLKLSEKAPMLQNCTPLKLNSADFQLKLVFDKQAFMKMTAIVWSMLFFVMFYILRSKLKSFTVEEINIYPNYLYLYGIQLISFQLFGLLMLVTMYIKKDKMMTTLYNALRE